MTPPERVFTKELKRPDENGRYGGVYGGKYVPETLIQPFWIWNKSTKS